MISGGYAVRKDGQGWRSVDGPEMIDSATEYWLQDNPPDPIPAPLTRDQLIAVAQDQLYALQRQANAQVAALIGRVDTLQFAVDEGEADQAETKELAQRTAQLKTWRSYNLKLGRTPGAAGWPETPAWPAIPEPYTSETST